MYFKKHVNKSIFPILMEKMTSLSDAEKFQSVHFHRFEISVLLLSHLGTSAYMQQELISAMQVQQKTM